MSAMNTVDFNGTAIQVHHADGDAWMTAESIGRALGYADPRDQVLKIFSQHRQELEPFSTTAKLAAVDQKSREMRVFNEGGVMIITMLSRQPRAAEFRLWAVQVLKAYRHKLLTPTPAPPKKKVRVNRTVERQAFEMFVAGWSQSAIGRELGVSHAVINLVLHGRYQFSAFAGMPEYSEALINGVAQRHLELERERMLDQHQRLANKLRHTSNNQLLANQLDVIGQQLQNNALLALKN